MLQVMKESNDYFLKALSVVMPQDSDDNTWSQCSLLSSVAIDNNDKIQFQMIRILKHLENRSDDNPKQPKRQKIASKKKE